MAGLLRQRADRGGPGARAGATLQLYNWVAYLNEAVVKSFCKKYDCDYQITTFNTMSEAMAKLGTGELKFDVFFPTVDVLGQLVESKSIRPLNQSYISNISNVWADYRDPFYDRGWQYTTPYSIYTTGMAWRRDKVDLAPSWNMPWEGTRYRGKVAVLDDYREGISLALLRAGARDLNATGAHQIQAAGDALSELSRLTDVQIDNNDFTDVPTGRPGSIRRGRATWHRRMSICRRNSGGGARLLVPTRPPGPVANDLMVNLTGGQNPVLAHLFIDYLLDLSNALENYSYVGYMQPLTGVTAPRLIAEKLLPRSLASTVVVPGYFREGMQELELSEAADADWEITWNSFSEGL